MTESFKEKLHATISLYSSSIDTLAISDAIDLLIKEESKELFNQGYKKGKKDAWKLINIYSDIKTGLLRLISIALVIAIVTHAINGISSNLRLHDVKLKEDDSIISSTLKACSEGDYTTCRIGWIRYFGDGDYITGYPIGYNRITAAFEEAYYNKTKTKLIFDETPQEKKKK